MQEGKQVTPAKSKYSWLKEICQKENWTEKHEYSTVISQSTGLFTCTLVLTRDGPRDEKEKEEGNQQAENSYTFYSQNPTTQKRPGRELAVEQALIFLGQRNPKSIAVEALATFGIAIEKKIAFHSQIEFGKEESKDLEFKGGRDYQQPQLYQTFFSYQWTDFAPCGKYICGFLNGLQARIETTAAPQQRGKIFYGVHDSGTVHGIAFNDPKKQKDQLRLSFDSILQDVYPPIESEKDVSLEFIKVTDWPEPVVGPYVLQKLKEEPKKKWNKKKQRPQPQHPPQQQIPPTMENLELYVVCVTVFVKKSPNLYWYKSKCYIREEASVTTMPPPRIEAHYRKKALQEVVDWCHSRE